MGAIQWLLGVGGVRPGKSVEGPTITCAKITLNQVVTPAPLPLGPCGPRLLPGEGVQARDHPRRRPAADAFPAVGPALRDSCRGAQHRRARGLHPRRMAPLPHGPVASVQGEHGAEKGKPINTDTSKHIYIRSATSLNHPKAWEFHEACTALLRPVAAVGRPDMSWLQVLQFSLWTRRERRWWRCGSWSKAPYGVVPRGVVRCSWRRSYYWDRETRLHCPAPCRRCGPLGASG